MTTLPPSRWVRSSRSSLLLTAGVLGVLMVLLAPAGASLGQIPDSGAQRSEMLREQRLTNQLLAEAVGLLKEIRDAELRRDGAAGARGSGATSRPSRPGRP
ncbi:MAG: hypothetical protein CHACPFDD_03040 [Phycisphaerae bacterium]|nr:hypothetical protein [Phycisphaerae bacterium]